MTRDSITRALLLTLALAVDIWYFSFFRPIVNSNILVIDKDEIEWPHEQPPIYIATIIADSGDIFGIDDDPEDMTKKEMYAFFQPGCQYGITYFDDARILHRARRGRFDAKTIHKAKKLSCPGLPKPLKPDDNEFLNDWKNKSG